MSARADLDRGALLCALVLAPNTFARNRFFALFTEPSARKTRARAAQLRTIIRHLSHDTPGSCLHELAIMETGQTLLRYGVPRLKLERTSVLEKLEVSLVRFAISRRERRDREPLAQELQLAEDDRDGVVGALSKLAHKLDLGGGASDEKNASVESEEYHRGPNAGDS